MDNVFLKLIFLIFEIFNRWVCLALLSLHFFVETMDRIDVTLELLNILIHSTINGMVKIRSDTLSDIKICLQNAQDKIEFLQLESQLQQEELQNYSHDSKIVFV